MYLHEHLDSSYPLEKLKANMTSSKCSFEWKTVSIKYLKKSMKQLKSINSTGKDGLSQSQLKAGVSELAIPLQDIINNSIIKGQFPSRWKEGIVTPVFKKGDKSEFENYRPVTCLPTATKLLENK